MLLSILLSYTQQAPSVGRLVVLFDLDLAPLGGEVLRCTNNVDAGGQVMQWRGQTYVPARLRSLAPQRRSLTRPDEVRTQFDTARNLLVYAWYVYEFGRAAVASALGAVELAIREKCRIEGIDTLKKAGLRRLITVAIDRGWLRDGGFPHLYRLYALPEPFRPDAPPPDPEDRRYCRILAETLPITRNGIAHGDNHLDFPLNEAFTIDLCGRIVDQLFPATG